MDLSDLKTLIECTICLDIRRGQIFQCENGHVVCAECKEKVWQNCPSGSCGQIKSRNLVAENFRNKSSIQFHCQYEEKGCEIFQTITELESHEVKCQFRMVSCSYDDCDETMMALEFDGHVDEYHKACQNTRNGCHFNGTALQKENHEMECSKRLVPCPNTDCSKTMFENEVIAHIVESHDSYKRKFNAQHNFSTNYLLKSDLNAKRTWKITYDEDTFKETPLIMRLEKSENGFYYAWIQIIGPISKVNNFKATISAHSDEANFEVKNRRVFPIDKKSIEIMNDESCFCLSEAQVKQCRIGEEIPDGDKEEGYSHKIAISYQIQDLQSGLKHVHRRRKTNN